MKCDKCEGVGKYPVRSDNSVNKELWNRHPADILPRPINYTITAKTCEKCNGTGEA